MSVILLHFLKIYDQPISYIIFGYVWFRFSHIDQENVEMQKNEWGKWAGIHYESAVKETVEE